MPNNRHQGKSQMAQLQQEVDEVTEIMAQNIQMELEREGKLKDLDERAEVLNANASVFAKTAARAKNKMWWESTKAKIALVAVILLIVLLITVPLSLDLKPSDEEESADSSVVEVSVNVASDSSDQKKV